jgi:chemotaxis protein CheC
MKNSIKLNELEIDALKELGNIGIGNVATSLSKFINKKVDISVPETGFVELVKVPSLVGGPETIASAIYLEISGGLKGEAVFLFPESGALEIVDIIMKKKPGSTKKMDELDESAFKELSNILTGSFVSSLAKMLDVKLLPSVPHTATDMVQALLDFILIKIGRYADVVLCVKTQMNVEGHNIDSQFLVFFDEVSLKKMLSCLHSKFGLALKE